MLIIDMGRQADRHTFSQDATAFALASPKAGVLRIAAAKRIRLRVLC